MYLSIYCVSIYLSIYKTFLSAHWYYHIYLSIQAFSSRQPPPVNLLPQLSACLARQWKILCQGRQFNYVIINECVNVKNRTFSSLMGMMNCESTLKYFPTYIQNYPCFRIRSLEETCSDNEDEINSVLCDRPLLDEAQLKFRYIPLLPFNS